MSDRIDFWLVGDEACLAEMIGCFVLFVAVFSVFFRPLLYRAGVAKDASDNS